MARKYSKHGPREDLHTDPEETPVEVVPCWLCGRPAGKTVVWHHPIPKSHGGRDVLSLRTPDGGSETLWLSNRVWDVAAAERKDAAGKTMWKIEHEEFEDDGGFRLPKRTSIAEPAHKALVRLRWKDRELNAPINDKLFHLEPGGLQPQMVGCQ